jgi:hypothetical protein
VTEEQAEILRDAQSRGSLIDGHPDLNNKPRESKRDTRFELISFNNPGGKEVHWSKQKAKLPSGYGITTEIIEEWKRNQ